MSVLDLDFYKLTMLQFIWKHYAEVPVTFRLHSRKQDLTEVLVDTRELREGLEEYAAMRLSPRDKRYLDGLGLFDPAFLDDLQALTGNMPMPTVTESGVEVSGNWFDVTLWETVVLADVTGLYSEQYGKRPSLLEQMRGISLIEEAGANWADFGTRRRHSYYAQARLVQALSEDGYGETGFIGTSNVHLARLFDVRPIGTYAHELEMVLRNYFSTEFETTRDVLTKWQDMYEPRYRVALTDTYTTPKFLADHGEFLLDNEWRGIRLDSGNALTLGIRVRDFLRERDAGPWDVVFSDGLTADVIYGLQQTIARSPSINAVYGWGTALTNPHSNLSLVMKAVESNGWPTYKTTDDETKAIR